MGAVDQPSPRPLKLHLNKGKLYCWNPDSGATTPHNGWEGWFLGWHHKDNSEHPDPRFRKPSVLLRLHDGEREALLEVNLVSGSWTQFMCCIQAVNLRQPIIIRPWTTKDGKTGGVNLFQGGAQVQPVYTQKNLNGMPPVVRTVDALTKEETVDSREQLKWLLAMMEEMIGPQLLDIAQNESWEPAPPVVAPPAPALPAATQLAIQASSTTQAALPVGDDGHLRGPDDDDVPA